MRLFVLLATLTLLIPVTASQRGLILGTEELPELPPSGPASYPATYTGARDHTYLEILAGWFSYDNHTDEIVWTLKTADGQGYANPNPDWSLGCSTRGNVTGGTPGSLRIGWGRAAGEDGNSWISFTYAAGNSDGLGQTRTDSIKHRYSGRMEAPAYFEFRVNRSDLLHYGAQIEDFDGQCSESYSPRPEVGVVTGQTMTNHARSTSKAIYSFAELRRVQSPDGSLDPIETFERANQTVGPSSATSAPSEGTPAMGWAATILALALIGFVGRRPRTPT